MEQKEKLSIDQMEEIAGGDSPDSPTVLITGHQECHVCHHMIKIGDFNRHLKHCIANQTISKMA